MFTAKAPTVTYSLSEAWAAMKPRPAGILDQFVCFKKNLCSGKNSDLNSLTFKHF